MSDQTITEQDETREAWLRQGAEALADDIFAEAGIDVPTDYRVSCGWPVSGGASAHRRTIGQCFPRAMSSDHVAELFISPNIDDAVKVLAVLAHEIVHMIDDCVHGHRAPFGRMARAIGLTGKLTATEPSEEMVERLNAIIEKLGAYPHKKLDVSNRKKQTTRMIKLECNDCEAVWRMSRRHAVNVTACPCCGGDSIAFGWR